MLTEAALGLDATHAAQARRQGQVADDAIRPVIGSAEAPAGHARWQQCTTETPGRHRFGVSYTLELAVPEGLFMAALDAAKAHFAAQGHVLAPPDGGNRRAGATLPKSTWTVALGVNNTSAAIGADPGCVFTTHGPKTT